MIATGIQPDPRAAALVSAAAEAAEQIPPDELEAATRPPLTPEHKCGSLIAKHRAALIALTHEAQTLAAAATGEAETNNDHKLYETTRKLTRVANSIYSRLLQIRAVKDTASTLGIKPGTLNQKFRSGIETVTSKSDSNAVGVGSLAWFSHTSIMKQAAKIEQSKARLMSCARETGITEADVEAEITRRCAERAESTKTGDLCEVMDWLRSDILSARWPNAAGELPGAKT